MGDSGSSPLRIAVALRQVPSTETRITISSATGRVDLSSVDWVINPYDEYALEEALRLKERIGAQVTAISFGPERVRNALKTALATGADEARHIPWEPSWTEDDVDSLLTARVLAAVIREGDYQLVLCGLKGIDDDMGYVPAALAELLDWPHVSAVVRLELAEGGKLTVGREIEGGSEVLELALPAVLAAQKGLNEPRYPSLRGMLAAGRKELPIVRPADWETILQQPAPRLRVLSVRLPPERQAGRIIGGTAQEAVSELVRVLREEAKVI